MQSGSLIMNLLNMYFALYEHYSLVPNRPPLNLYYVEFVYVELP